MTQQYPIEEVARYFLAKQAPEEGDLISHLKLQKLCYYAQGLSLATRGVPLFKNELEAWLHGPVVPDLYQQYKQYGDGAIPTPEDVDVAAFAQEDRMILDDVYNYYGQFSAWRLRQMTHSEAPWKDAFERDMNNEISLESLSAHFATEIDEEYRKTYVEISKRAAC